MFVLARSGHRRKIHGTARRSQLCQTEIQYLGVAALGDKYVRRLDVAMNDSLGVRRIERVRNLNPQLQHLLKRQRLAGNAVLQCGAFHEFHGDETASAIFRDFVDGADVWMIERRGCLGFALEAAECLRVFGYVVGQEFESDEPAELYIFGLVNHAHTAATELFDNAVVRDGLPEK